MSNVFVDKEKIDILANAISIKSGEPLTLTLDEMVEAVDGIEAGGGEPNLQSKTYTVDSAGTETITADSGYDGLSEVEVTVPSLYGVFATDSGFYTENGQRKWRVRPALDIDYGDGYHDGWVAGSMYGNYTVYSAVPNGTTITPTESSQTIGGTNYMMNGAVTVSAIPSNYVGSGITQRSSSDLTASSATVTVPSGYYSAQASKAVSTMTLPEFTSSTPVGTFRNGFQGTPTVKYLNIPQGYNETAQYYQISAQSGTAGTPTASKGTVSNHSVSVTPSVTNTEGYISGGTKTGTAVTVSASELVSGSETKTANGTYDVTNLASLVVNVSGGGGGSVQYAESSTEIEANSSSITFTGLSGEPTSFIVFYDFDISTGTPPKVAAVVFDGTDLHAQTITNTSNAQVSYDGSSFSKSYSNGTLTISSSNATFLSGEYGINYTYSGTASCIDTKDVQVGSGATSITFTGLEDEPIYWSCIFKSNFSTSNGYQRVIWVNACNINPNVVGMAMDSSAHFKSSWSASYNSGSLTITSTGTNNGGYFHQPGYYQLTYAYDNGSSGNYQSKTVTPSSSTQIVQADEGYEALSKVTVNPIPSSYVQPTATQGATTYRASTTQQTIASGTYLSGTQTIAPVSQTNLTAENIKSGTTISISNGQSNIWSVTGTYTGGGSSKNVQVLQSTSRTNSSSLTKVLGDLTVSKTGTYDIYWSGGRSNTSSSYTWGTRLYVDGSGYGTENTSWSNNCQSNHLSNVSLTANQKLSVYARGRSGSYYTFVPMLVIIEA